MPYCLIVPMTAGDRVLGVLSLRSPDRPFTDADERLIANIAQLAALMLRSARLYEERSRAFGELASAQDQLVRTEKLRALGEMASGVAHDFNNVLASILGRAQLLLERIQDVKLRRWLQVIERAAMDGARTVRRLQDFTGIRRDQPAVAVDLNQVVQQVLEATESTWRQDARRRGVEIEVLTDLAERLPQVAGDPAELREAFTNLVLNAVDAMPKGGQLTLRTSVPDGQVMVEVIDTGTGIPEPIRQKIFDPFFTTKGPKGTGLGLSMAYGILARHSGRITVESEEGRGTTFRLSFPPSDQVAEVAAEPTPAAASTVSLRCLVVDDEEEVAEVVADILTTAGHVAVIAASGQAAVDLFSAEPVRPGLHRPGDAGHDRMAGGARREGQEAGGRGGDDERIRGGGRAGGAAHQRGRPRPVEAAPDQGRAARGGDDPARGPRARRGGGPVTSPIITEALRALVDRRDLSRLEAAAAMEAIMSGAATNAQIAAFLTALRMKGETVEELIGFAQVMRQKAVKVRAHARGPGGARPAPTARC